MRLFPRIEGTGGVYRLDWIEQLKLKLTAAPTASRVARVSPVVWSLGYTSLLTDISTEMVNSALPVYLVLHLHLSPLQFGVIDGLYNGLAVALLSIVAGLAADRWARHKEMAGVGYGLSAICKLLLMATGSAWLLIAAIVGLDRAGKGIRAAPRDAIISFNTERNVLASAFAVHRALDAGGALLGPIAAFVILDQLPGQFDVLWLTSFVFAVIGFSVLGLFVPASRSAEATAARARSSDSNPAVKSTTREAFALLGTRKFGAIAACALILSAVTVSDGFIYLLLQQRTNVSASWIPLFYVGTACFYMALSVPAGALADRIGHRQVLLGGYAILAIVYATIFLLPKAGWPAALVCLALMGAYYAASEGILMALASAIIPGRTRTSGLALIGTAIGLGKMVSSVLFGWLWDSYGKPAAVMTFVAGIVGALIVASLWLRSALQEQQVVEQT